mmetsp:Transcript_87492/g.203539  ORF Transcript_87492/g.203539 Transcript_87492/m.203539 type:complete len:217 (-) Transcript_87492:241-891(-)
MHTDSASGPPLRTTTTTTMCLMVVRHKSQTQGSSPQAATTPAAPLPPPFEQCSHTRRFGRAGRTVLLARSGTRMAPRRRVAMPPKGSQSSSNCEDLRSPLAAKSTIGPCARCVHSAQRMHGTRWGRRRSWSTRRVGPAATCPPSCNQFAGRSRSASAEPRGNTRRSPHAQPAPGAPPPPQLPPQWSKSQPLELQRAAGPAQPPLAAAPSARAASGV